MAQLITNGPGKGFYTLPRTLIREQLSKDIIVGERDLYNAYRTWQLNVSRDDELWYRYSPGPGKTIKGFNRNYLPFIDGYYYVRKDPQIDLRRQLYALETKQIPSSGNTETFNRDLARVSVPADWRPYYLDPCPADWCLAATPEKRILIRKPNWLAPFVRWMILALFCLLLAAIVTLAMRS